MSDEKEYPLILLPEYLQEDIRRLDENPVPLRNDMFSDNLYADLNWAEIGEEISPSCLKFLRKKYLDPDYVPLAQRT